MSARHVALPLRGPQPAVQFRLDPDGYAVTLNQRRAVFVRSEVAFIVGEARYCAGFPHRIEARGVLRVWPMADRAGVMTVYR